MDDLPSNIRLLTYSIWAGGFASIFGLVFAAYVRIPSYSPSTVWIGATGALTAVGGILAVPTLLALDRRKRRHG